MGTWYFEKKPHRGYEGDWRGGPTRHLEVAVVVGDRIRRTRLERGVRLLDLARDVNKPGGGHYSASHFSRLERGWANATLYVYLKIADRLEVDPWHLFAADEVGREARPEELFLLRFLRRSGISPEEALARIAGGEPAVSPEAPPAR